MSFHVCNPVSYVSLYDSEYPADWFKKATDIFQTIINTCHHSCLSFFHIYTRINWFISFFFLKIYLRLVFFYLS